MIYLTADLHVPENVERLDGKRFMAQRFMTRQDYLIVLGDFMLFWHPNMEFQYWRKWFEKKPFTTLWIDGNHENHEWIKDLPVTEWNSGKVHQTSENIIHLMRGQVYHIDGRTFFTMGGAKSVGMGRIEEGVNWWNGEEPSIAEITEGMENLERHDFTVDYVLTHDAPYSVARSMFQKNFVEASHTQNALDMYLNRLKGFKRWYFGHWHSDVAKGKFRCMYNRIVRLGE